MCFLRCLRNAYSASCHETPSSFFFDCSGGDEFCQCGCRGWCSLFPLLQTFSDDLAANHPGCQLIVWDIRSDWPAWVQVAGLRTWSHKLFPCACCSVPLDKMADITSYTLTTHPYSLYTPDVWQEEVQMWQKDA